MKILRSLVVIGLAAFLLVPAAQPQITGKPNILFILVDDLGWSDVSCYGNKFNETPNIDRLAKQGMMFSSAYAAGAVCSPTRASIQSGLYQARFGLTDFIQGHWRPFEKLVVPENAPFMPLEIVTVAETLRDAGYRTAHFGKWHLGPETHNPEKQGFDTSIVTGGRHIAPGFKVLNRPEIKPAKGKHLAEFLTDQAIAFMAQSKDRPFFIHLCHFAVHIPLESSRQLVEKYKRKPKPPQGINNPTYAALLEEVDQSVGRLVKALDDLGLASNTLLVFFSDNGGLRQTASGTGEVVTSNAPLRDEKGSLYEGGIRVPLIVRLPGVTAPGTVCSEPVISVDFYPTFMEFAGIPRNPGPALDGKSLMPLLRNSGAALEREAIYWHYPHYHHSRPAGAIRSGPWKLIQFFDDGAVELYRLPDDIGETNNLAGTMPDQAKSLRAKLEAWRRSVDARMPTPNPKYDPKRAGEWWNRQTQKRISSTR